MKKEEITCDICGKSFDSRRQMNQHREIHASQKKRSSFSKKFIVVVSVGILIAIAAGIGAFYAMTPNKSSSGSPSATSSALTINGIE